MPLFGKSEPDSVDPAAEGHDPHAQSDQRRRVILLRSVDVSINPGRTNVIEALPGEEVQDLTSDSGATRIGRVTVVLKRELDLDGPLPEGEEYDHRAL